MDPLEAERASLVQLEDRLNAAKERTASPDFPQLRNRSRYEQFIRHIRREIRINLGGQAVTKAWLKMYEMLKQPFIYKAIMDEPVIKAFFNAELPGAFVSATNHFVKTRGKDLDWVMASLWPREQEGKFLKDDYGLFAHNPNRSLMGKLYTNQGTYYSNGDVTRSKMPEILSVLAKSKLDRIRLYTADGGVEVVGQEALQEQIMIPIILGETLSALLSLDIGGVMILKIYTFFTPTMFSLLTLLKRSFNDFQIIKPFTSSPLNSELYVIGIGYQGLKEETIEAIRQALVNKAPLSVETTPQEKEFLINNMTFFVNRQIENINTLMDGGELETEPLLYLFADVLPLSPDQRLAMD